MRHFRNGVICITILLALTGTAWGQAQATTGVNQGSVADPSGAVIPGAAVEAKNLDTSSRRSQDSDANGRFVLLQLPSGRYTVTASKTGFATIVQENVTLSVGEAISLNIAMKV